MLSKEDSMELLQTLLKIKEQQEERMKKQKVKDEWQTIKVMTDTNVEAFNNVIDCGESDDFFVLKQAINKEASAIFTKRIAIKDISWVEQMPQPEWIEG